MMQLLCNGVALDLYENTGLQFKHTNPLFAFDKLECERTTQFKLPSTPTNDRVFTLARIPAYSGEGMRRKFTAQLQAGAVVKDGYLYISSFDGKDYVAIFVTGEFIGLQTIKDLGKIGDFMSYANAVSVGQNVQTPLAAASSIWANVEHRRPAGDIVRPSILIEQLYNDICTQQSITAASFPVALKGLRWICGEIKGLKKTAVSFARSIDGAWKRSTQYPFNRIATGTLTATGTDISGIFDSALYDVSYRYHYQDSDQSLHTDLYSGNVQHLVCKQRTKITFPDNFPADVYLGTFEQGGSYLGQCTFYGDRSFSKEWSGGQAVTQRSGEPLARRSVTLEAGQSFVFLRESDLLDYTQYTGDTQSAVSWVQGWQNIRSTLSVSGFMMQGDGDMETGVVVRLQDNLPDITFVELCKMIAYLTGTALNYTQAGGLQFDPINFGSWTMQYVERLMERGEVARVFGDYAQQNIVGFNSSEWVRNRLSIEYTIDNDNLEAEKVLATIPASEGEDSDGFVYVEGETDTIGTGESATALMRVALPKNTNLQALCTASTQFKIKARMSIYIYHIIEARTRICVQGTEYVWTERSWQNDVATFTLAKIA